MLRFKSTKYLAHITGISTRPGTPLKQKQNKEVLPRRGAEVLHILQLEETPTKHLAHVTKIRTTLGTFPLDNYVLPVLCPISDIIVTFLCFVFLYFSTSVIKYFISCFCILAQQNSITVYESLSDVGEIRVWFASKNLTPCRMH